jgi:hypothetical protein
METLQVANRWWRWVVRGSESVLKNTIDNLDGRLPSKWVRVTGDDLKPLGSDVGPNSYAYELPPTETRAGVLLTIDRVRDAELRGRRLWFTPLTFDRQPTNISTAWNEVVVFLDEGVLPAAKAAGASTWDPSPDEVFMGELPAEVASRLREFSTSSQKRLPLNREESERWQSFVISAFRMRAVVDPDQFVDWLVTAGWGTADARELSTQFFEQCRLLSRFSEEVTAA